MANDPAREQALPSAAAPATHVRLTMPAVLTAYRRMAPVYNWVFGGVFQQGRKKAIAALDVQPGERVLEVGVGTGLTLRHWPRKSHVTAIDVSPEMLARAERARDKHKLEHVQIKLMDAQAMKFADNSFDKIAAMYVVSVVPNLSSLLAEVQRVCVPGGRICIVNHFEHPNGAMRRFEQSLSAYAGFLGFDSALPIERVTGRHGLRIRNVSRVNLGGYWWLIEAENAK